MRRGPGPIREEWGPRAEEDHCATLLRLPRAARCATALLVLGALVAGCGSSSAATTRRSGASLVSLALRNAVAARWVHETVHTSDSGHVLTMDNSVGRVEGRQVIEADGAHAQVILIHRTAYIEGDAKAVVTYFGFRGPNAKKLAGKWISLTPTDSGYRNVASAVTLKSDFQQVALKGPFEKSRPVTVDGKKVIPIRGVMKDAPRGATIPVVLEVTASGAVLPVALRASGDGIKESVSWNDWGHAVILTAPHDATPISSLGG